MTTRDRRAQRLLRWYPSSWRATHEEEFIALLEDSFAEQQLSPRRGIDIAVQGTRARLAEAHGQFVSPPEVPLSGPLWPIVARTVLFADLVLFAAEAYLGHSRASVGGADAVSFAISAILVVAGIAALAAVVGALHKGGSVRSVRPLLALGGSLLGIVAADWWTTSSAAGSAPFTRWGSHLVRNSVIAFDPSAWVNGVRGVHFGAPGLFYLLLSLFLLLTITISAAASGRRFSRQPPRRSGLVRRLVAWTALLTVIALAWLWAAELSGGYLLHAKTWVIAALLTLSGAATVASTASRSQDAPAEPGLST